MRDGFTSRIPAGGRRLSLPLALSAAILLLPLAPPAPARADEPVEAGDVEKKPKPSVEASAVYYGDAAHWKKPAEVDADAVYAEIPEYKQILAEGLGPDDAKYQLLMNKASRRFVAAVKKAARAGKYDLVARKGAVENVDDVPDITDAVIQKL